MGAGVLGGRGENRRADNFSPSIPQSVTGVSPRGRRESSRWESAGSQGLGAGGRG